MRAATAIAVVLVALAGVSPGQIPAPIVPPLPGDPGMPPALPYGEDEPNLMVTLLLHSAGLSSDQSRKVHHILTEHRPALRGARRNLRAAQDALADRMTTPGPLEAKDLESALAGLTRAHRAQIDEIVATALAVREVLTPEQLARAARWKDHFRAVRNQMQDLVDEDAGAAAQP